MILHFYSLHVGAAWPDKPDKEGKATLVIVKVFGSLTLASTSQTWPFQPIYSFKRVSVCLFVLLPLPDCSYICDNFLWLLSLLLLWEKRQTVAK